jgi:hypothetical protein
MRSENHFNDRGAAGRPNGWPACPWASVWIAALKKWPGQTPSSPTTASTLDLLLMPTFLAFFSGRNSQSVPRKSPRSSSQPSPNTPTSQPRTSSIPSPSIADTSEQLEESELSLEAEYVLADPVPSPTNSNGVYPLSSNGASTSTTKLKMPFRRKQPSSNKLKALPSQSSPPPSVPSKEPKSSVESSVSVSPSLLPPPSRSAIFGSYADPHNALSTRSLPQGVPAINSRRSSRDVPQTYETMSNPDSHSTSFSNPQSKEPSKGGLFSWARPRGRTKSKPSLPHSSLGSAPVLTLPPADSFNLKSFRHVAPPETPPSGSPSETDPPPRPRPRGDSFASDSSQRISVAAFREAQARRSATNSPVPSLPGDRDGVPPGQVRNRRRSALGTPPSALKAGSQPRSPPPSNPPTRSPPARSSTAPLSFSASLTSSESSDEEESESEEEATLRPRRRRTITSRSAQSEVGFRSSPILSYGASRSDIGHGSSGMPTRPSPSPRNNVNNSPNPEASGNRSRTSSVYSRARTSLSTSALVSEAATKRAPVVSRNSAAGPFSTFRLYACVDSIYSLKTNSPSTTLTLESLNIF